MQIVPIDRPLRRAFVSAPDLAATVRLADNGAVMAHMTARTAYAHLVDRLNQFPQGAPPSDLLYRILALLFSEREAELVAQLPIRPFTAARAAQVWALPEAEARRILETLASRAILLDVEQDGEPVYVLPPPMAGFFEFSMMRVRGDVDQRLLAELFYQYLNVEEDFIRELFATGETRLGRAFVHEPVLTSEQALHVMDYERASHVVTSARDIGIGLCYCRHKMQHVGRACDAPLGICMTFGGTARSLIAHDYARRVDAAECLDLLAEARGRRLVQFGENVRERVAFICNCCGCCCEAMLAAQRFGSLRPIHTTNYLPEVAARDLQRVRPVRDRVPGRIDGAGVGAGPEAPEAEAGEARRRHLPRVRRVRRGLRPRVAEPARARRARHHAARLHAPRRADGHRARHAPEPHRRHAGARQPPGHGRDPRRHPEAPAAEAGAREPAVPLPLPRAPARRH